jgi:nucleotide-binding universal stress UspA family protein
MHSKKILIPLDGSMLAEAAIAKALEVAGPDDTLILLRAAEVHALPGVDPTDAQVEIVREAEEYLAVMAKRLREKGFPRVETSVWYGPAASTIVEAARLRRADLIVMSTHGRSGIGRLILGSVAESVLRHAHADSPAARSRRARGDAEGCGRRASIQGAGSCMSTRWSRWTARRSPKRSCR